MFGRSTAGVPNDWLRAAPLPTVLLALLASGAPAQTFTVNTTIDSDDGACTVAHCSLREAIHAANAAPGGVVVFDIPGPGPHTIRPTSALPIVFGPMTIDGTSEPDFAGTPVIELDGTLAGPVHGLAIGGVGNVIRGLVVNRFQVNGISLEAGSSANRIEGCFIGTDLTGTMDRGNGNAGVLIGQSPDNVVGGVLPAARNIISGNIEGVTIVDVTATRNLVIGNYIGTDVTGTSAIPNDVGVLLLGPNNTVGGFNPGTGNLISGNRSTGVTVQGPAAAHNLIQGNRVGTDASGTTALSNGGIGIWVYDTSETLIGGPQAGAGNLIAGNDGPGISIAIELGGDVGRNHVIQGNWIGVDVSGEDALPNGDDGIRIAGGGCRVGGAGANEGNVISGNRGWGIHMWFGGGNVVEGNLIGLSADGDFARGNEMGGVSMSASVQNFIGSATSGARNVISGNSGPGILVEDPISAQTVIQNNYIGTDIDGEAAVPNEVGILISGPGTQVGGAFLNERNVISGNTTYGVDVGEAPGTIIEGNYIGTDANGSFAIANEVGIRLNGTAASRVGGTLRDPPTLGTAGNVISGNTLHGMRIGGGASGNLVQGNLIGVAPFTASPLGNGSWGIHIFGGAIDNVVGGDTPHAGNLIAHNGADGIFVRGDLTKGNEIRGNAIHSNGQLGIDIQPDGVNDNDAGDVDDGPNDRLNYPVVMGVADGAGVMAKALMFDGLANEPYTFEFFGNSECDPSGFGEGEDPLGTVQITSAQDGDASIAIPVGSTTHLTATVTDGDGNTSEFSACVVLTNFALDVAPATRTVAPGGTATYQVTVSATGGAFPDAVELGCSGGPAGSTCTFSQPEVIPGQTSATSTMTISTPASQRAAMPGWSWILLVPVILVLLTSGRRRRARTLIAWTVCAALVPTLACQDDATGPREGATYQLQVTGEWEGVTHGQTATLIVR